MEPSKTDGSRALETRFRFSPRFRLALQSLGLALWVGGVATLSIVVFRAPLRSLLASYRAARAPVAPLLTRRPRLDLRHDQALVNAAPERAAAGDTPPKKSADPAPARSASELFEAAKRARIEGDLARAVSVSQQIEQLYPNSAEGIATHLSLGVIYLQERDGNRALGEFALYRRIGNPETLAEALWGQAQALGLLERASDERQVLEELLRSYPRSAYVGAATARVKELSGAGSAADAGH